MQGPEENNTYCGPRFLVSFASNRPQSDVGNYLGREITSSALARVFGES